MVSHRIYLPSLIVAIELIYCDLCAMNSSLEIDGGRVGCGYISFRSPSDASCSEQTVPDL